MATESQDDHWADCSIPLPWSREQLIAVENILNRSWFERVWIIQEVMLAREKAILLCGTDSIPWKDLCTAVWCLYQKRSDYATLPKDIRHSLRLKDPLDFMFLLCTKLRVQSLHFILERSRAAKCSDPRDRVFGILSLINERWKHELEPDYTKIVAEIYQVAVLDSIKVYTRLDI